MPDTRAHRGPHPEDKRLFDAAALAPLRAAAADYCWLLNRGYPSHATLALVGNRHRLDQRQRTAIARFACTDLQREDRRRRCLSLAEISQQTLALDGFNVLTTIEAALAGGVVLAGRDGTYRDLASMHGSYRKVSETVPALSLIGQTLAQEQVERCRWLLDRPVSNSGRLKAAMLALAADHGWDWEVELVPSPDSVLKQTAEPVATADSIILDECRAWVNLARRVVEQRLPAAWVVELEPNG